MRVHSQVNGKPKYEPITITLETAEEYFSLLAALGSSSTKGEIEEIHNLGLEVDEDYISPSNDLYGLLKSYFEQVKETL